jgi:hypothetical protein
MHYEVIELAGEWVVHRHGREVARFEQQDAALADVRRRFEEGAEGAPASFAMRFEPRR